MCICKNSRFKLTLKGIYRPILLAHFNTDEEKIFYVDEELKIREQNIFVTYRENGSEFEKYVKPNEIMTNYYYEKQRQDSYKEGFEKLYNVLFYPFPLFLAHFKNKTMGSSKPSR